ncbi:hypothetical protein J4429_02685 [Candidatus Pacearchaeota archaeon]|nr:hypothetical protein [Candidatus Pacearchaeota archaeon]
MINDYRANRTFRDYLIGVGKTALIVGGVLAIPVMTGSLFGYYHDGSFQMQLKEEIGAGCAVLGMEIGLVGFIGGCSV